jgi:hypothetical protein
MKGFFRLRQAIAVVGIIVLAACDAAQNVSPNVDAGSNARLRPTRVAFNHGGRFTAAYSGSYSKTGDCSATAMFTYKGNGNARFLHSSSEEIKLTWICGSRNATGSATLTSSQVPGDSITSSVSSTDFMSPCYDFTLSFAVTGGTGRFRHASGSGTIVFHRLSSDCSSYPYSDKWRGTLKFRGNVKA